MQTNEDLVREVADLKAQVKVLLDIVRDLAARPAQVVVVEPWLPQPKVMPPTPPLWPFGPSPSPFLPMRPEIVCGGDWPATASPDVLYTQ